MSYKIIHYNRAISTNIDLLTGHEIETLLGYFDAESIKNITVDKTTKECLVVVKEGTIYRVEFQNSFISDVKIIKKSNSFTEIKSSNGDIPLLSERFIRSKRFQKPLVDMAIEELKVSYPFFLKKIENEFTERRLELALWEVEDLEERIIENKGGWPPVVDSNDSPF